MLLRRCPRLCQRYYRHPRSRRPVLHQRPPRRQRHLRLHWRRHRRHPRLHRHPRYRRRQLRQLRRLRWHRHRGFGLREMGKPDTVDPDTVFQLASFSKPIASTIVAAVVSDGTVAWDSRISDIDTTFQLHDAYPTAQVTIRDLFAHRSGLFGEGGNDLEGLGFDRDEIVHRLRYLRPASSFRAGYAYSNFGVTEGALATAKATGRSWEDIADEKLYRPLGMRSTSSRYTDFLMRANRASLHVRLNGIWTALVKRNPDAQSPAGGVSSNARDLAEWMHLELGNGKYAGKPLIKQAAIEETHLPTIMRGRNPITGDPAFYGLGWNVDYGEHGVVWGHAGAFSQGARTVVNLIPSEQLGIVVVANAFPIGVPEGIADTFFDLVFAGKPSREWVKAWNEIYDSHFGPATIKAAIAPYATPPASPTPAMPLSAYAGTYANDYVGDIRVVVANGALELQVGPAGRTYPLKHFDRDLFVYAPFPETPDWVVSVTFAMGAAQRATQVTIENLNDDGQGVLLRVE
ncbi:CubicO group peptidase, beta-lactamase class C family [Rhizobiales bacterium GAS188]|nr:CubicO group peptidase, beta-lactamase class C family [Rhizobiales bacterium GAS188]